MKKPVYVLPLMLLLILLSSSLASCMPRMSDDKQFSREKAKIALYAVNRDIPALMGLLHSTEFRSSELSAYWLGRLGAKEALPELDVLHSRNRNLCCPPPSGAFGAAAARIRVADLPLQEQIAKLLAIAKDYEHEWVLASEVGRILIDYDDPRILPALRQIRTYGAQETAVRLEIKALPASQRLELLVKILTKHESPQRAEAADLLLREAGAAGADAVMKLLHDQSLDRNPLAASVKNRAWLIVHAVGTKDQLEALSAAGWKWGKKSFPVKTVKKVVNEKRMNDAIDKLSNSNYLIRFDAAMALREMPLDERAVPALKLATDDREIIVQRASLEALSNIDSDQIIPIMVPVLQNKRREFRYLAAKALWKRGVRRGVKVFIDDLRADDAEVRKWADIWLERLTGMKTDYWYGDPVEEREKHVQWWEKWVDTQPSLP
ncbi:MAG: HEAT repeat domain-containing protein [bacterium]|nr:HEAT repeat domain-containing protein [bacterium]